MKGLSLAGMKKIAQDGKQATFRHDDGHEIKVALGALSPDMKKKLSQLPIHAAEGTDVEAPYYLKQNPDDAASEALKAAGLEGAQPLPGNDKEAAALKLMEQTSDAEAGKESVWNNPKVHSYPEAYAEAQKRANTGFVPEPMAKPSGGPVGIPANAGNQAVASLGLAPEQPQRQPDSSPDASAPAPQAAPAARPQAAAPAQGSEPDEAPAAPAQPPDIKQELTAEQQAWENDLHNGHITPQTYESLFAKKDTLGKVGTLFGLLVSGAGAGLTHQPNAVLEMMNKEINNDLEAQKQSKVNAQNFIKLNQQHELNQATVKNMGQQTQLLGAQTDLAKKETDIKAYTLAQSQMLQASYHHLVTQVDKMPEGQQKEAAKQQLGFLYSKIGERINNLNDAAAGAKNFYDTMFGGQQNGAAPEQQFQNKTNGMRMLGPQGEARAKDLEEKHFPGLKGQASVPLSGEDRSAINSGMEFDQKLHRFIDWTTKHSGDLSPTDKHEGEALAAELQGSYRQATHGGVYKEGEQNFISKLIDSEPTKFFNNIRVVPQLKAIAHENKSRLNQLVKSKGFPGYEGEKSAEPQYKTVNGVKYMRGPNGEAIKVK